jgi:hypothetical protein
MSDDEQALLLRLTRLLKKNDTKAFDNLVREKYINLPAVGYSLMDDTFELIHLPGLLHLKKRGLLSEDYLYQLPSITDTVLSGEYFEAYAPGTYEWEPIAILLEMGTLPNGVSHDYPLVTALDIAHYRPSNIFRLKEPPSEQKIEPVHPKAIKLLKEKGAKYRRDMTEQEVLENSDLTLALTYPLEDLRYYFVYRESYYYTYDKFNYIYVYNAIDFQMKRGTPFPAILERIKLIDRYMVIENIFHYLEMFLHYEFPSDVEAKLRHKLRKLLGVQSPFTSTNIHDLLCFLRYESTMPWDYRLSISLSEEIYGPSLEEILTSIGLGYFLSS